MDYFGVTLTLCAVDGNLFGFFHIKINFHIHKSAQLKLFYYFDIPIKVILWENTQAEIKQILAIARSGLSARRSSVAD